MPKKERNLSSKLNNILNLPPHITTNQPQFQLSSNRELVIEGCFGLVDYSSEMITIRTSKYCVTIYGRGLTLQYLEQTIVQIKGFITKLEFGV